MADKRTVLYIDHDPTSQMLVDRTLRYAGYNVKVVGRGLDGIDIARSQVVDLILTDIDLPDITGRELTTVLRSDQRFIKVPIVALTDLNYTDQRDLAMAAGLTGYITKPLDVDDLPDQIEFYLGGGRDEIDRERLTAARSRYTRELVTQLETRVRELESKNKDLMRLDQLKDTFLQVTAHELRTPLTLVYGYGRLLQDSETIQVAIEADPSTQTLLDGLVDAIERMQTLVNEILTMSRIMTDQFELSLGPVNLVYLFNRVIERYENALAGRNLTATLHEDGFPSNIRADSETLLIVMDNIISNAIKYTPDDGQIDVRAYTDGTYVYVQVKDTGIGIPPEDIELIFDRFHTVGDHRLHSTSKTAFAGGGIGLGLAICKGIVEAHGGSITVKSDKRDKVSNPGSEFIIKLPLNAQARPTAVTY
jgi:signal transduction histidine kinase